MIKFDIVLVLRILFTVCFLVIIVHFFLFLNKDISSSTAYDANVRMPSLTFCPSFSEGIELSVSRNSTLVDLASKLPNPNLGVLFASLYSDNITTGAEEKIDLRSMRDLQKFFGVRYSDVWSETFYHMLYTYNTERTPIRCLVFNPPTLPKDKFSGITLRFTVSFKGESYTSTPFMLLIHEPHQSSTNGVIVKESQLEFNLDDDSNHGQLVNYELVHSRHTYVNRDGYPCDETNSVKRQDCFNQAYTYFLNCTVPWMPPQEGLRLCSDPEDYANFMDMYNNLKISPYKEVVAKFGCLRKNCEVHSWQRLIQTTNKVAETFIEEKQVRLTFYQFKDNSVVHNDYIVYGLGSFWADFGAYLGLLLGVDLLSLILMGIRSVNRVAINSKFLEKQLGK